MSQRPAPRHSGLAGRTPALSKPVVPPEAAEAAEGSMTEPAPTSAPLPPAESAAAQPKPQAATKKASFYLPVDEAPRMRAAYLATRLEEGWESLSDFISIAILEKVEEMEQKYNNGEPWKAKHADRVPRGRPVSS